MSSQLKGGSYEINPQGEVIQKAGTAPAPRNDGKPAVKEPASKPASSKPTNSRKGQTA